MKKMRKKIKTESVYSFKNYLGRLESITESEILMRFKTKNKGDFDNIYKDLLFQNLHSPTNKIKITALICEPKLVNSGKFTVREVERLLTKVSEEDLVNMCKEYQGVIPYIKSKDTQRLIKLLVGA